MNLTVLTDKPSLAHIYLNELRDSTIQKDSWRFRNNLKRMAMLLACELSIKLDYKSVDITTPLGISHSLTLSEQPVLLTILRAGMPMLEGVQEFFDAAPVGMIGAYRLHAKGSDEFEIKMDYSAIPNLSGKTVCLIDTMLATGRSLVASIELLKSTHNPKRIIILSCIAAQAGIDHVFASIPNIEILVGTVDAELNEHYYIVPGLGDAGDLAYGPKL